MKDSNGERIPIERGAFSGFKEYIDSIKKTSEIADVETSIDNFGHEDVKLVVSTTTDNNEEVRDINFKIQVKNWKDHLGGSSSYTRNDMCEYTKDPSSDKPAELMFKNGAFFHRLENEISDILKRPGFRLERYDNNVVVYSSTFSVHKFE